MSNDDDDDETVWSVEIVCDYDGTFTAYIPELPGCVATGRSFGELDANLQAAVREYLGDDAPDEMEFGIGEYRETPEPEPHEFMRQRFCRRR